MNRVELFISHNPHIGQCYMNTCSLIIEKRENTDTCIGKSEGRKCCRH